MWAQQQHIAQQEQAAPRSCRQRNWRRLRAQRPAAAAQRRHALQWLPVQAGPSTPLPTQGESVVAGVDVESQLQRQLQDILKPPSETDFLQEFLAIQNQQPRNIGFFGTRNMGFMHQQLIEVLAYAMVLTVSRRSTRVPLPPAARPPPPPTTPPPSLQPLPCSLLSFLGCLKPCFFTWETGPSSRQSPLTHVQQWRDPPPYPHPPPTTPAPLPLHLDPPSDSVPPPPFDPGRATTSSHREPRAPTRRSSAAR